MSTHQATKYGEFFTFFGGIIALSCFFMPWMRRVSAYKLVVTSPITSTDTLIIIAFIASIASICASYYMLNRQTPWKSRIPVLMSSGIGLGVLSEFQFLYILKMGETGINVSYSWGTPFNGLGFWGAVSGLAIAAVGGFFIRAEEANKQSKVSVDEKQLGFIVLAGGIIALLCFFMPWERIGDFENWSGFKLMRLHPYLVIVFAASIIIMVGSFYTLIRKTWQLRVPVLVSIGIGVGLLFSYFMQFYLDQMNRADVSREFNIEIIERSIKFGSWGTILGFIVAVVGMFLTTRKNRDMQVEIPVESG